MCGVSQHPFTPFKRAPKVIFSLFLMVFFIFTAPFSPLALAAPANPSFDQSPSAETNTNPSDSHPSQENQPNNQNDSEDEKNQNNPKNQANDQKDQSDAEKEDKSCLNQISGIGWLVCPGVGALAKGIDSIYGAIDRFLKIKPLTFDSSSPIALVWQYFRDLTNIIFIILFILVIYSQVTGIGFTNYNIKRVLPRIIVAAVLINLSFFVCSLSVDISNILGASLRDFFQSIETMTVAKGNFQGGLSWGAIAGTILAGAGTIGALTVASGGLVALLWTFVPVVFGAFVSVLAGFFTIAARQAVVSLLIMISPLAFVAYLLPNTESYFRKWKQLFTQMLIFYPAFSVLFGASNLAGWAIISSSNNLYGVVLGIAIQIFPLFFSVKLMQMSGTVLNKISSTVQKASAPLSRAVAQHSADKAAFARAAYYNKGSRAMEFGSKNFKLRNSGSLLYKRLQDHHANEHDALEKEQNEQQRFLAESMNARRLGRRIIGRDKDDNAIYSSHPVSMTKEWERHYRDKVGKNRLEASETELTKQYNAMGSYLKYHGSSLKNKDYRKMDRLAKTNLDHFGTIYSNQQAIKSNDLSDRRDLHNTIIKANQRDANGQIIDQANYDKFIKNAAGYDALSNDFNTANDAIIRTIADSYEAAETDHNAIVKKYTAYYDKMDSVRLRTEYHKMLETKNIAGITATATSFKNRGDLDIVSNEINQVLKDDYLELGTENATDFAKILLTMKGVDPTLFRLAKHINMQNTAYLKYKNDPSNNKERSKYLTMEEYFTGVDSDGNEISNSVINLLAGTDFSQIDRTAFESLNQLSAQYLSGDGNKEKREKLFKNILPKMIEAMPNFSSDSEQILNTMGQITGLKYNTSKKQWKEDETLHNFMSDEEFTKQAKTYLESLTPNNIINMKSNSIDAIVQKFAFDLAGGSANFYAQNERTRQRLIQQAEAKFASCFSEANIKSIAESPDISTMKARNRQILSDRLRRYNR